MVTKIQPMKVKQFKVLCEYENNKKCMFQNTCSKTYIAWYGSHV